jgi:hypothetical protein
MYINGFNTAVRIGRHLYIWGARCRSYLRHCAASRKVAVAGSIPDGVIGIFH